ncbi:hypothetical protein Cgig2_021678 [Carnegiea gigantea]|uniref:Uncharacterized protein n=1 Tax=Carnegiea gigantea TaxID=171969 RepID=A0A9Q1KUL9_9CARY|nr:hypothetical protein Cgig2_021678 [Carnegiea gigantea]
MSSSEEKPASSRPASPCLSSPEGKAAPPVSKLSSSCSAFSRNWASKIRTSFCHTHTSKVPQLSSRKRKSHNSNAPMKIDTRDEGWRPYPWRSHFILANGLIFQSIIQTLGLVHITDARLALWSVATGPSTMRVQFPKPCIYTLAMGRFHMSPDHSLGSTCRQNLVKESKHDCGMDVLKYIEASNNSICSEMKISSDENRVE